MEQIVDHEELEAALGRCGSTWEVAQAHGLLCARLAADGPGAAAGWMHAVLDGVTADDSRRADCAAMLEALYGSSYRQLVERQSEFVLVLPDESAPAADRARALAWWCEGFLHGLVSGRQNEQIRDRLGRDPLADVIRDLLQITQAVADDADGTEANELAYAELVEYVRVAAQLTYEELADLHDTADDSQDLRCRPH